MCTMFGLVLSMQKFGTYLVVYDATLTADNKTGHMIITGVTHNT